ncbi:MAG: hypothetical protein H6R21_321 [Proteobacteria bacterium]|nr:hypothetical protein [Pseudomonadota bacterium]RPJ48664.1 MAG: hypothetical protein EHM16_01825 [Betaproteobacteria bacterium]
MAEITTQQMAQLMIGVARSQLALIDSIENSKAGFKFTHVRPTLETASRIRSNHAETLADFPSRLLLQMLGRNSPDLERVAHELETLCGGISPVPPREGTAPDTDAASLDMTQN